MLNMNKKGPERFKTMSIKQLDKEIDKLPYNWMKALMYTSIKEVRPDYILVHLREKNKKD
jgi:hypothetical protein